MYSFFLRNIIAKQIIALIFFFWNRKDYLGKQLSE